jgi:accessory gene regulator protein AgrB
MGQVEFFGLIIVDFGFELFQSNVFGVHAGASIKRCTILDVGCAPRE